MGRVAGLVAVGVAVAVAVGVKVAVGVGLGGTVDVAVAVAVAVGVALAVAVAVGVTVAVAVAVAVGVAVGVGVGVNVAVTVGVGVGVPVEVAVGVGLGVGVTLDVPLIRNTSSRSSCAWEANSLYTPASGRNRTRPLGSAKPQGEVRLDSAVTPTPLPVCSKPHVRLNLDPIGARREHRRRDKVYGKCPAVYRHRLV